MLTTEITAQRLTTPRRKPQYFAISYTESRAQEMDGGSWQKISPDWFSLAGPCETRELAEKAGLEAIERQYPINPTCPQFERATCQKNLRIISKSQQKAFHVEPDTYTLYDEGE